LKTSSRRRFLKTAGVGGALAAAIGPAWSAPSNLSVGIVGAGLAGLSCAYELKRAGLLATVYEASEDVGGRCASMPFYGQTIERGGELIDTSHKSMINFARDFGLTLESYIKPPGDTFFYFNGQHYSEAQVIDELRAFVPAMRNDLRQVSGAPSADNHTLADIALDNTSLAAYLDTRGAGPLLRQVLEQAYIAEYGRKIAEQSCLNFLLYMRANRRTRFQPFGVSDERYHIVEGNQQIARGLALRLSTQVVPNRRLEHVSRNANGSLFLEFAGGYTQSHDVVVLATPFTVLRASGLLDANLGLPSWKQNAIQLLGYGTNAKMMVGFASRPWAAAGSNGAAYADLPNVQNTWETNPSRATANSAVLVDYGGGLRGAGLNPANPQGEAGLWVGDLNDVFPGAFAAANAAKVAGNYRVHLEHWPSHPLTLGSYTCYRPGQFTTLAGNEAKPVGNLLFAGEHTNSFYEFQGFMEGALLSGAAAAQKILKPAKV
jgi:monoamine oxidase